jgi:hypothetical protein
VLLSLASTVPAMAQSNAAGRVTFQVTVHIPDSMATAMPIRGEISMQMDLMTDGKQVAFELVPSAAAIPAGMRIKLIYPLGGDSVHVGVMLPPEMTGMTGGAPGLRMDLPTSMMSASNPLLAGIMDSAAKKATDAAGKPPRYRKLGTTSTVAGLRCEEWEAVVNTDTTLTCVIPTPSALLAMQAQFKKASGMGDLMDKIPGMADLQKQAYNGAQVTPIRMSNSKSGMHMELLSYTPGAPNPDVFTLPANLQAMPMPGGGGR